MTTSLKSQLQMRGDCLSIAHHRRLAFSIAVNAYLLLSPIFSIFIQSTATRKIQECSLAQLNDSRDDSAEYSVEGLIYFISRQR